MVPPVRRLTFEEERLPYLDDFDEDISELSEDEESKEEVWGSSDEEPEYEDPKDCEKLTERYNGPHAAEYYEYKEMLIERKKDLAEFEEQRKFFYPKHFEDSWGTTKHVQFYPLNYTAKNVGRPTNYRRTSPSPEPDPNKVTADIYLGWGKDLPLEAFSSPKQMSASEHRVPCFHPGVGGKGDVEFQFFSNDYLKMRIPREVMFGPNPPANAPAFFDFVGYHIDHDKEVARIMEAARKKMTLSITRGFLVREESPHGIVERSLVMAKYPIAYLHHSHPCP